VALQPLIDALAAEVMASDTLHVDDTAVPVLAPDRPAQLGTSVLISGIWYKTSYFYPTFGFV